MSTCETCKIETKRQNGEDITTQERNHWMLWGCTCETEAEALSYMALVTQ